MTLDGALNVIKLAERLVAHSEPLGLHSLFVRVGTTWSDGLNRLDHQLPEALQNR